MNNTQNSYAPHNVVAYNPDEALVDGLWWLKTAGVTNDSRNGRVLVSPVPVITTYPKPAQRVIFNPTRDANPFFHFFEGLWMLAGRNEAASVAVYAKQMETFADDGLLWGAYGFRWREFFAFDQLKEVIQLLRRDPRTRRAVLTMWSPNGDLVATEGMGGIAAKDVPCNTQVYFDLTSGKLNMTVSNRSNDIVWGAYGANVVHMSMMQEFVARAVGAPLGVYYQFSNNYHAYIDRPDVKRLISDEGDMGGLQVKIKAQDPYLLVGPSPMMATDQWEVWLEDCEAFVDNPMDERVYTDPFWTKVAQPLMWAHSYWRLGNFAVALASARDCEASDWRLAAVEWLLRRQAKAAA